MLDFRRTAAPRPDARGWATPTLRHGDEAHKATCAILPTLVANPHCLEELCVVSWTWGQDQCRRSHPSFADLLPCAGLIRGRRVRLIRCRKTEVIVQLDDERNHQPERNHVGMEVLVLPLSIGL